MFAKRPYPDGIDDCKRLSAASRERLFAAIVDAATVSVAIASRARIDRMNILWASLWAMARAVDGLALRPDHVLVDGNRLPDALPCPSEAIVGGDGLSVSIAAASIVAKVTRDRLMEQVGAAFPDYGFEHHRGYSTAEHFCALRAHGPCPHHRQSFTAVREQQLVMALD